MRHPRFTLNLRPQAALPLAALALATLALAPVADGAGGAHSVTLNSTIFAAQIGSTRSGASVYAGAVVDPKLAHGAVVFSTSGTNSVHLTFHEFFPLGSINGTGRITVVPGNKSGQRTFTGSLTVTSGTGRYQNSRGELTARGNISKSGMTEATVGGSFTY